MRSVRGIGCIVGTIAVMVLGYRLPWSEPWREVGPLVLILALALIVLAGEFSALAWRSRSGPVPRPPRDARPADGEVGIVSLMGVRSGPNPNDPRFRRFL